MMGEPATSQSRVMKIDALPAVPWKNGGGVTRNLAIEPEVAGLDNFLWRVSIADVAQSGEFSPFPGVDCTIVLLSGNGMILESGARLVLNKKFAPHAFRGEEPIRATLIDGPTRDFNVMVKRGLAEATVEVWRSESRLASDMDDGVFICAQGAFLVGKEELRAGYAIRRRRLAAGMRMIPDAADAVLIGALIRLEALPYQ